MPASRNYTSTAPRPRSPLRYSSVSSSSSRSSASPSPSTSRQTPDYTYYNTTADMTSSAMLSYPGSPAPSITSTISAVSYSGHPQHNTGANSTGLDLHELYSPGIGKFMCPMGGCLYGVLGFPTTEELEQHITILGHYPEPPSASLDPRVTILNFDHGLGSLAETDSWLASQQQHDDEEEEHFAMLSAAAASYGPPSYAMSPMMATPPQSSPFQFTFAYDGQPTTTPAITTTKKPSSAPAPPSSPTSSQCDCPHCHLQNSIPFSSSSPAAATPSTKAGGKRKRPNTSIYDYATPLTVQLAPPITIIGLPTIPSSPTSKSTSTSTSSTSTTSKPTTSSSPSSTQSPKQRQPTPPTSRPPTTTTTTKKPSPSSTSTSTSPSDYALWQQKIQLAQATEQIQAQLTKRRKLEISIPTSHSSSHHSHSSSYPTTQQFHPSPQQSFHHPAPEAMDFSAMVYAAYPVATGRQQQQALAATYVGHGHGQVAYSSYPVC